MSRPMHPFHRTELLVGGSAYDRLTQARVCVIGLGGVGAQAAEALVRTGVGHLTLVDFDKVCVTNVNRQIHATRKTVGKRKATLMAERCLQINPKADVRGLVTFYEAETAEAILGEGFDHVFDCIDNMAAKLHLLESCVRRSIPVISAMGAGGRLDPTRLRVSDISETHTDPFAKIVRENLRKVGIHSGFDCVWSDESPNALDGEAQANFRCICPGQDENTKHTCDARLQVQGSVAWMPAMFGLCMAGVVVNRLIGREVVERPAPDRRMKPAPNKPTRARKDALLAKAGLGRGLVGR